MNGFERLQSEALEMNNYNIVAIFDYLKTRKDIYDKFENEEKSIKQMYEFICDKARKQKVKEVAMITDNLVYIWAVTYFIKSNKELELTKKEKSTEKNETKSTKTETNDNKPKEKEKQEEQENQLSIFQEVN